ncbi:MAG: winged helix-turn-helix domain-containing protein [Actinomycetota bacterium]
MAPTIVDDSERLPVAHVALFGPVSIQVEGHTLVPSGLPAHLLALLALHRGERLSAERLLDLLWPEAPESGRNALQRHVSALRRLVRDVGATHLAARMIDHRQGTYRLDPAVVRTDLDRLADHTEPALGPDHVGEPPAEPVVRWWLEPLAGLPYETFAAHRVALDGEAAGIARRWLVDERPVSSIVAALTGLVERQPHDTELVAAYERALAQPGVPPAAGGGRWLTPYPEDRQLGVAEPVVRLLDGDPDGAMTAIDEAGAIIPADTQRRMRRWVDTLDVTDGLIRSMLSALVAEAGGNPLESERAFIAIEVFGLLEHPDGLETARKEAADAVGAMEHTRSQRVLAFALMGSPLTAGLEAALADLAAIDDLEAVAEAGRLSLAVHVKRGRFQRMLDELDGVQRQLDAIAPNQDWLTAVMRSALHEYEPTHSLVPTLSAQERHLRSANDMTMLDTITLWHRLERRQLDGLTAAQLGQVTTKLHHLAASALDVKYLMALGRVAEAEVAVRPYRRRLATLPRNNWVHLLYVVVAEVALACGDRALAAEVATAIEPWSGEYLGNYEVILGPADDLLAELHRGIGDM